MQSFCTFEGNCDDLKVEVTSQFRFSNCVIEEITNVCVKDNLKLRFRRGNNQFTIILYQTHPIGIINVLQIKYEDFIKQKEGKISGEIHHCFTKSPRK